MSSKRISIRKVIQTAVTVILLGLSVFVMLSAAAIQDKQKLKGLHITIENEADCRFIDKDQIRNILFTQRHLRPADLALGKTDVRNMEHILLSNPWIESAQVFIDGGKQLQVSVTQRTPQLRVFARNGDSYYIDEAGHQLPLSEYYTHYELVFVQVPELQEDSLRKVLFGNMLYVARLIKHSAFWMAQTSQVIVNGINDFSLVPVLGNQRILLGDTSNLQQKFDNVFAFYKHIENRIGWDRYEVLDARFRDQVIAAPSLPWKAPVDRALSNMNWVKSIIGNVDTKEQVSAFPLSGTSQPAQAPPATR